VMSIIPVMLLHASRKYGDRNPEWSLGWTAHPILQATIIIVYGLAFLYSIGSIFGIVPAGWA
ncbi:MAG: amino acid permease, partial [Corynebacterium casei]